VVQKLIKESSMMQKEGIKESLKISFAGLLHDIGKFAQGGVKLSEDYKKNNQDIYLPFHKAGGYFSHFHALYTIYFIENNLPSNVVTELDNLKLFNQAKEDSFINLAGKHHKPETPLQWIIAEADRLSSGFDRKEFNKGEEIDVKEVFNTRLIPIFERLLRDDKPFNSLKDFEWEYPLAELSVESIFPVKRENRNKEDSKKEYETLWEKFIAKMDLIKWQSLNLWIRSFDSLLRIYTSQVPSVRVGMIIPDISLYEHLRTTASLAGALYLYHKGNQILEVKEILKEDDEKFLLVSGDFYGIQDFIFRSGGEERHHRAKILRGRSFMVSLLTELCAELICEELGLSFMQIFLSAAGRFHLLAPNLENTLTKLEEVREKITAWFKNNFYLESGIGLVWSKIKPIDFKGGNFVNFWKKHLERLEEVKYRRFNLFKFGGRIEGYLDRFKIEEKPLCPLCGKRASEVKEDFISCKICKDQIYIGTNLVKKDSLAILKGDKGDLEEPILGVFQVKFLKKKDLKISEQELVKIIDFNINEDGTAPIGNVFLPLNGYVPVYSEEDNYDDRIFCGEYSEERKLELLKEIKEEVPKSFYYIAKKALKVDGNTAYGIEALGVFKADVDNLGAIFACGLPKEIFTMSRLSTMSRKLHEFFSVYLPYAIKNEKNGKFKEVYTVFAGGDDLFLIGPWNIMPELGLFLSKKFKEYTCFNPKLHFSAGISLHKPNIPVEHFARDGETALEEAKKAGKNRVCMFEATVLWEEFKELFKIEKEFRSWYEKGISKSMFYRLNELIEMAKRLKEIMEKKESIKIDKLSYARWPALLRYYIARNVPSTGLSAEEIAEKCFSWIERFGEALRIPLWKMLYEIRKQKC